MTSELSQGSRHITQRKVKETGAASVYPPQSSTQHLQLSTYCVRPGRVPGDTGRQEPLAVHSLLEHMKSSAKLELM